jgi:hypothetical protein
VVWLILLAVLVGLGLTYLLAINLGFMGAFFGILLIPVLIAVVVAIEERGRRRAGLGDRSSHFDANKPQMANYNAVQGQDPVTAYGDKPTRASTPGGVNVDEGDRAP